MPKWLVLLLAVLTQALFGYLLWLIWILFGEPIVYGLVDPEVLSNSSFPDSIISELKLDLANLGEIYWILGAAASLGWLVQSSFASLLTPQDVSYNRVWWWSLLAVGAVAVLFIGYLSLDALRNLHEDVRLVLPTALLLLYLLSYWIVGSWGFTRKLVRPAVPGATWFNRVEGEQT